MKNKLSQKIKYIGVALGNAIMKRNEKNARLEYVRYKERVTDFKDMSCFGNSEKGPWECSSFREAQVCCRQNCPMHLLNKSYISAYHAWKQAKIASYKQNGLLNLMRENMGIRRSR